MSDPYPLNEMLPSQSFQGPQPEKPLIEETEKAQLTDTAPQVETNPASPLAVETRVSVVESRIHKVCKTMFVTTLSLLMVIAWASALMLFSGFASYRVLATMPFFRVNDFQEWLYYPPTCALVVVLLLSPVYAVVGDVRIGNFRMLLAGVTPFLTAGLVVAILVSIWYTPDVDFDAITVVGRVVVPLLLFLPVGIFQANAIQVGRAALRDVKSPELSAFVHWYYWALYLPTFLTGAPPLFYLLFPDEGGLTLSLLALFPTFMFTFLMLFVVTLLSHCKRCVTGNSCH